MKDLILNTINVAIEAGKQIQKIYNSDDFHIKLKNDKSPLTDADLASNKIIVDFLEKTGIPIISEENKQIPYSERKNWKKFWLVDPLDGTKEFIKRNGQFTVNIALVEYNSPIFGVIYLPEYKILYFGHTELGSFKCENISEAFADFNSLFDMSQRLPMENSSKALRVLASKSHFNEETQQAVDKLKAEGYKIDLLNVGSSLKFCTIAEGKADIYPRFGPTMEWDIAAGHAILKATGGNIIDVSTKNEMQYNKENLLNPYFIAYSDNHKDLAKILI